MMKVINILSFILLVHASLFSQKAFERLYQSDERAMTGADIAQTSDGGYLFLSNAIENDTFLANVTKVDPKGDIKWSKDYQFEENRPLRIGELVLLERDTFMFTLSDQEARMNKILCKAAPNGDLIWSNAYGNPNQNMEALTSIAIPLVRQNGNSVLVGNTNRMEGLPFPFSDIYISFMDSTGLLQQGLILDTETPDNSLLVSGADTTQHEGIIICGRTGNDGFLMKLDSLGNSEWNRTFNDSEDTENIYPTNIISTLDTGYLVVGYRSDGTVNGPSYLNGLVVKFDSLGLPQWTVNMALEASLQMDLLLSNVANTFDGGYIITGGGTSAAQQTGILVVIKLDALGNIQWTNKHLDNNQIGANLSSVITTSEGGYAMFGTFALNDEPRPYFVKLDLEGSSSCEDTISLINSTVDIFLDTFSLFSSTVDSVLMEEVVIEDYDDFAIPVLSLENPPPFCEDEPILWTFDATIPGAVSYDWNTGETTDSIIATEEGMYIVNVRVEEDICFNLCDTANISIIGPPMVQIIDSGDFCSNGSTTLNIAVTGSIDSISWSTGENMPTIEVVESGVYSVIVFNRCGSAEDFINIQEIAPEPSIDITGNVCLEEVATLSLSLQGVVDSIVWNTGENTPTIEISEVGTYSVTVFNQCGSGTATLEVLETLPEITLDVIDSLCFGGETLLSFELENADSNNFFWFQDNLVLENETNDTLVATTEGVYKIVATNNCGTDEDEYTVECTFEDCVQVPNVFTPNNDGTNDDFLPIIKSECSGVISIRDMRIYNRWGQLVFENKTGQAWDGEFEDKLAPSDVYIFYVETFNSAPEEGDGIEVFKGDVTLVR